MGGVAPGRLRAGNTGHHGLRAPSGGSHILSAIRGVRSGPPVNWEREELDPLRSELLSLRASRRLHCPSGVPFADPDILLEAPGVPEFLYLCYALGHRSCFLGLPLLRARFGSPGCHTTRARSQSAPESRCRYTSSGTGAPPGQESTVVRTQQWPQRSPCCQHWAVSRIGPPGSSSRFIGPSGAATPNSDAAPEVRGVFLVVEHSLCTWMPHPFFGSAVSPTPRGPDLACPQDCTATSPAAGSDHRSSRDPLWLSASTSSLSQRRRPDRAVQI
ncbi:hypothetical protein NDU88_002999 [Pleurodeles waltl]|uniref:Uncharacterized protein n=1 Tax=Pleurodeles waltl TaxID=8319 RepID=A0AAV7TM90_PLEWA|nr:hypothetical protein NDU88_002999 [Pleurodeles waltl]